MMRKGTQETGDLAVHGDEWDAFAQDLYYISGDLGKPEDFIRLGQRLEELEGDAYPHNRLFYLSVAPQLYERAVKNLGASGLAQEDRGTYGTLSVERPSAGRKLC